MCNDIRHCVWDAVSISISFHSCFGGGSDLTIGLAAIKAVFYQSDLKRKVINFGIRRQAREPNE